MQGGSSVKSVLKVSLILGLILSSAYAAPFQEMTHSAAILKTLIEKLSQGRIREPQILAAVILQESHVYKLDPLLILAVIQKESSFRPHIVSSKGAIGLMQVVFSTGRETAKKLQWNSFSKNDLFDPVKNVILGIYYLNKLKKRFQNNKVLFLTAYNNGLTRLLRIRKMTSDPGLKFTYATGVMQIYQKIKIQYVSCNSRAELLG